MKSNQVSLLVAVLAIGLWSPMAIAADKTNSYSDINTPASSRTIMLEGTRASKSTTLLEGSNLTVIDKTVSTPVVIERASASPMVVEDRIIKQKHLLGLGIWPLFDFEVK